MLKAALTLLVVVAAVWLLVRLLESRLAFFPLAGETVTPREFGLDYEASTIESADGERLWAWELQPAFTETGPKAFAAEVQGQRPLGRILYFHGNGGNLSLWAPVLAEIARHGYSVLAFDYRGYGRSTGHPTETGLYRDVDAVLERFWSGTDSSRPVIYWGRSLGVAMAAYAATVRAPDGLILESGFPDVRSLLGDSLLMSGLSRFSGYRFPAATFMQRVSAPALVMHGDDDRVIPYEQGRLLFERIRGRKSFVTIRGGDHNDASPRDARTYWAAVNDFSAGL